VIGNFSVPSVPSGSKIKKRLAWAYPLLTAFHIVDSIFDVLSSLGRLGPSTAFTSMPAESNSSRLPDVKGPMTAAQCGTDRGFNRAGAVGPVQFAFPDWQRHEGVSTR